MKTFIHFILTIISIILFLLYHVNNDIILIYFSIIGWYSFTHLLTNLFVQLVGYIGHTIKMCSKKWNSRIIEKNRHRTKFLRFPFKSFFRDQKTITRDYIFTESCLYKFNTGDDKDINKLFGIGLRLFPKIINKKNEKGSIRGRVVWFKFGKYIVLKPQNISSFMYGWNIINERFIGIYRYSHNRIGKRNFFNEKHIAMLPIETKIRLSITIDKKNNHIYYIGADEKNNKIFFKDIYLKNHKKIFLLLYLDLWFGGNRTAPHNIIIKERKIKE